MNSRSTKHFRVVYLAFLIPFILTWLSWAYLPVIANWIVANLFGYKAAEQSANPIWLGLIVFFYTWYTLLAVGVAGTGLLALYWREKNTPKQDTNSILWYPSSFPLTIKKATFPVVSQAFSGVLKNTVATAKSSLSMTVAQTSRMKQRCQHCELTEMTKLECDAESCGIWRIWARLRLCALA